MSQVVKSRSKEQVRHVTLTSEEIGEVVWQRMVHTCRNVPVGDNYYLSWFLRGTRGFDIIGNPSFAPPYLTRAGFDKLKVSWCRGHSNCSCYSNMQPWILEQDVDWKHPHYTALAYQHLLKFEPFTS